MIAINVIDNWDDGKRLHVVGNFVLSGNYTQGGDTANFGIYQIKSASPPIFIEAIGQSLNLYRPVYGGTINSFLIKIFGSNPAAELATGAYSNSVINDVVTFFAMFKKMQ